ncbi:M48 family metallopeptidase [Phyllobacterium sp. YR531]|uniref:M48 family metallopeptidase n=1 Tax=Phyllobacterium sp. YR531 TaxID=1144343 RepID=UPI00026FC34B|nr:M48 family metallopeptidase [Phyllobacterium sp. YR531]EJN04840.1 Peptidase family M48 [Phyllobacterium sp. YR531]
MASDQSQIAGVWYPYLSSRQNQAFLTAEAGSLSVVSTEETLLVSDDISAVTITGRVGNIPRRLTFSDGTVFETPDNDAIDRLVFAHRGRRSGWIHSLERFHPRLLVVAVLAIAFTFGIYRYGLPVLVNVAVAVTPPIVPELMAKGTMQTLDATTFNPTELTEEDQTELLEGFERLAVESEYRPEQLKLQFRQGGLIGPNAFALPDGTIIITDELVEMADGDSEMLLGVLAHEIGHVELEHSLKQVYRSAGAVALIMLIGGDIGSGTEDILTQGAGLLALSHSRAQEAEADRRSVEMMLKAGYNPEAIGRFFKLIQEKLHDTSNTSMLSTHPGTPDRLKSVQEYMQELQSRK